MYLKPLPLVLVFQNKQKHMPRLMDPADIPDTENVNTLDKAAFFLKWDMTVTDAAYAA